MRLEKLNVDKLKILNTSLNSNPNVIAFFFSLSKEEKDREKRIIQLGETYENLSKLFKVPLTWKIGITIPRYFNTFCLPIFSYWHLLSIYRLEL